MLNLPERLSTLFLIPIQVHSKIVLSVPTSGSGTVPIGAVQVTLTRESTDPDTYDLQDIFPSGSHTTIKKLLSIRNISLTKVETIIFAVEGHVAFKRLQS